MPLKTCNEDGDPGFKWGDAGKCYTYPAGDDAKKNAAKRKAILQGVAVEGGSDKMPKDPGKVLEQVLAAFAHEGIAVAPAEMVTLEAEVRAFASEALPTVEMDGVDILATGGPYFGSGSPKEGDYFTEAQLQEWVKNTNVLMDAGELTAPAKIGHNREQKLATNSGLSEDEKPAVGWLENLRVEGGKVLTAIREVPEKFAKLLDAGAFKTRSVELANIAPQTKEGKARAKELGAKRLTVISGLAWLGAKAPAVRTLDEIAALYGHEDLPIAELLYGDTDDPDITRTVNYSAEFAAGDVLWKPNTSFGYLRDRLQAAFSGGGGGGMPQPLNYWVQDISFKTSRDSEGDTVYTALVCDYTEGASRAWVVPFDVSADGDVKPAPVSEWTMAEQAWVEVANDYAEKRRAPAQLSDTPADTYPVSTENKTQEGNDVQLSAEAINALAESYGISEDDEAKRREAVEAKLQAQFSTPAPAPGDGGGTGTGEGGGSGDEGTEPAPSGSATQTPVVAFAEFEALKAQTEVFKRDLEERRLEKRTSLLTDAIKDRKIHPSKREFWESVYDENPARAAELLAEMPSDPTFNTVFGSDDDITDPGARAAADDAEYRSLAAQTGILDPATLREAS